MSLIGRLLDKLLKQGSLTILLPGKPPQTFGPGGGQHLTVKLVSSSPRRGQIRIQEASGETRRRPEAGELE